MSALVAAWVWALPYLAILLGAKGLHTAFVNNSSG